MLLIFCTFLSCDYGSQPAVDTFFNLIVLCFTFTNFFAYFRLFPNIEQQRQYVSVIDPQNGVRIDLPTRAADNSLALATLVSAHSQALLASNMQIHPQLGASVLLSK
jgi:hypothetical protein